MKRQFSSWTSGLTRRSRGIAGGRAGPWASFPSGRRSQPSLWSSGWIWTAIVVGILLIFSVVALSTISPTPVPAADGLTDTRVIDTEAAVPAYDPALATRADTPLVPLIIDMVWKLSLVAALIVITAWVLRYLRARFGLFEETGPSGGTFAILDTVTIGPDQSIHTVDMGQRVLVIGATGSSLTSLADISDPDEILYLRRRSGIAASEFEDLLGDSDSGPETADEPPPTAPPPFQDVADRLRVLAENSVDTVSAEEAGESDNS